MVYKKGGVPIGNILPSILCISRAREDAETHPSPIASVFMWLSSVPVRLPIPIKRSGPRDSCLVLVLSTDQ